FINAPPTPETYPLSLHDALPIFQRAHRRFAEVALHLPDHEECRAHVLTLEHAQQLRRVWPRAIVECQRQLARRAAAFPHERRVRDRKSTRLNSSHLGISYAVFCL